MSRAAGIVVLVLLLGHCAGSAEGRVMTAPPRMVWIGPGVWVVEDYPYTVYYADGYYWYLDAGIWYRAPHWDYRFVRVQPTRLPASLRVLPHDHYRHYRAPRDARRFRPGRGQRPPPPPPQGRHHPRRRR